MKFLDLAKVYLRSGSGGNGCISFRREKYIEFGGPDGGDGGGLRKCTFPSPKPLDGIRTSA